MCVKYIVKNVNEVMGIIKEDYTFEQNEKYKGIIPMSLLTGNVKAFLKSRVIQEDSQMIDYVLEKLGLKFYNVEMLINITHGQLTDDKIWLSTDDTVEFNSINIWNNFVNQIELDEKQFKF